MFVGKAFGEVRGEPCAECASAREISRMTLEEITAGAEIGGVALCRCLAGWAWASPVSSLLRSTLLWTSFAKAPTCCRRNGRLLRCGLASLAAAKQASLFPYLLKLTRQPEETL